VDAATTSTRKEKHGRCDDGGACFTLGKHGLHVQGEDGLLESLNQGGKMQGIQDKQAAKTVKGERQQCKSAVQHAQLGVESAHVPAKSLSDDNNASKESSPSLGGEKLADSLGRTIFVGNLPQGTTSKDVKKLFKRYIHCCVSTYP
jgi:hypothetical protein